MFVLRCVLQDWSYSNVITHIECVVISLWWQQHFTLSTRLVLSSVVHELGWWDVNCSLILRTTRSQAGLSDTLKQCVTGVACTPQLKIRHKLQTWQPSILSQSRYCHTRCNDVRTWVDNCLEQQLAPVDCRPPLWQGCDSFDLNFYWFNSSGCSERKKYANWIIQN